MSEHIIKSIAELEEKLAPIDAKARELKTAINSLAKCINREPPYPEAFGDGRAASQSSQSFTIRSDQFHGQPLATAMREIFEMRRGAGNGPATVNELYDALVEGAFGFETKNDENAKRGLRVSLGKNPVFYKLPNGLWGLKEWYPNAKTKKVATSTESGEHEAAAAEEEDDG